MGKTLEFVRRNPVVVLDVVKAAVAVLLVFGLPIPAGLDVAAAALVVAALTVVTRQAVTPNDKVGELVDKAADNPKVDSRDSNTRTITS